MIEIKENWKVVFYAALTSAVLSVLCFIGMFIVELYDKLGWEIGLMLAFATLGCTAAFLLLLYAMPYIVRFIVECFEYFTRYR